MNKLWLLLLILIFISCNSVQKEREEFVNDELKSRINKKLELPFISDNLDSHKPHKHKIVSYINGDCPSCIEHLSLWEDFVDKINCKDSVLIIIYLYSSNYEYLDKNLKTLTNLGTLIIEDKERLFPKKNKLSDSEILNTFVTDKENKVQLMGNPVLSKQLGQLYLKLVNGEIANY